MSIYRGTLTDASGTITAGGTRQQVLPANRKRIYLLIANLSTDTLYINFDGLASTGAGSIPLLPDGTYVAETSFCPTGAVDIYGATTGDKFTVKYGQD